MGVCSSTPYANDPDYAAQVKYSQMIDRQLRDEKVQRSKDVKILLLGAGESVLQLNLMVSLLIGQIHLDADDLLYRSGKTTVLKQMQILHDNGFSAEQRDVYRRQVRSLSITSPNLLPDYSPNLMSSDIRKLIRRHHRFSRYCEDRRDQTRR